MCSSILGGMHGADANIDDWLGTPILRNRLTGTALGGSTLATEYQDMNGDSAGYAPLDLVDGLQTGMRHLMVPAVFNSDSPGHMTWLEWHAVLNGMKDRFPLESMKILQVTKRLKNTLPNGGMGELTTVGNSTFGALLRNSMRDGYIAQTLPGFSVTTKLERTSQNGPAIVDGKWFSTSSPVTIANQFQWNREDSSNIVDSYTPTLAQRIFSNLNY